MLRSLTVAAALLAASPALASEIFLDKGQVHVVTPGVPVGTVVVGDPAIADATVDGDTHVIVFGKGAGSTDLVIFDQNRQVTYSAAVTVGGGLSGDGVVVNAPGSQTRWLCQPGSPCVKGDAK